MGQDIVSLGIDVSSFSPTKLARLNDFIVAFDKLEKFDGKTINPAFGTGLTAFNDSVTQTTKLLEELNIKIQQINTSKVSPVFDAATVSAKNLGTEVDKTSTRFRAFSDSSTSSIAGIGRQLTHAIGYLRTIAYILPGIGLAGIFNLGFEAIKKVAEESGILNNSLEDELNYELALNKSLKERIDLYDKLYESGKKLSDVATQGGLTDKDKLDIDQSRGYDQGYLLTQKQSQIERDLQKSTATIIAGGNSPETLKSDLERRYKVQENYVDQISTLQKKIDRIQNPPPFKKEKDKGNISLPSSFLGDVDDLKKQEDNLKLKLSIAQESYNIDKTNLDNYQKLQDDYYKNRQEIAKFDSEQERKILVETTKDTINIELDKNKEVLADERSTQEQRIQAIKNIKAEEDKLAEINKVNVTGTKENPNVSATKADIDIANDKASKDRIAATIKDREAELKVNIDYYQRLIKATTEKQKDEIESDAIVNEKIFQNEKIDLDKRLDAYNKYTLDKLKLQELEYQKDIQQGASKSGDITSLTPEESKKLLADKVKEQKDITANAQKDIYDIVHSSLEAQLKDIQDNAKEEESYNKESEINAIEALNGRLQRKEISIKRYNEERKKVERKFGIEELDGEITDDEKLLNQLRKFEQDKLDIAIKGAQIDLVNAKESGDTGKINKAQGNLDALLDVKKDTDKAIKTEEDKEQSDRLKRAKLFGKEITKEIKDWAEAVLQIEKALYNSIKELTDQEYEYRLAKVEKQKELIDEQYGYEQNAIEQSSLSAKDKAALDVQLQAQKKELDINTQAEEKRIKLEQFEFDKKLSIANIIINTAAGIVKAIPDVPKEVAAAAVGAIELATAIAQQPPSFKHGVTGFKGGFARYGEAGAEWVKEPYKPKYLVMSETISYLPKGTDIIPIKDSPEFGGSVPSDGWEQTLWLGKQMRKNNREIKNIFKPIINVDLGFENYKRNKLYGR